MLRTSEVIIAHPEVDTFEHFIEVFKEVAKNSNERFLKLDVKPDYEDTPENWEDRVEAAFY
jgi:hypothetical protein